MHLLILACFLAARSIDVSLQDKDLFETASPLLSCLLSALEQQPGRPAVSNRSAPLPRAIHGNSCSRPWIIGKQDLQNRSDSSPVGAGPLRVLLRRLRRCAVRARLPVRSVGLVLLACPIHPDHPRGPPRRPCHRLAHVLRMVLNPMLLSGILASSHCYFCNSPCATMPF